MGKPFIFGIGPGKTGTNSLVDALTLLGFKAVHLGHDKYHGLGLCDRIESNAENNKDLFEGIDGVDAFADFPMTRYWKSIHAAYPDAKFILTYRDPFDAARSWLRMTSTQADQMRNKDQKSFRSYRSRAEYHIKTYDEIMRHFWGSRNFAVISVHDSDSTRWRELSRLLGVLAPPDGTPYPRSFTREDY